MSKRILWIEDHLHELDGLFRPLQLEGFKVYPATSAVAAFRKVVNWLDYDLVVVDLILPLTDELGPVPDVVSSWTAEDHVGIGLLKWMIRERGVPCSVAILSILPDPVRQCELEDLELVGYLEKRALRPSAVRKAVRNWLARSG